MIHGCGCHGPGRRANAETASPSRPITSSTAEEFRQHIAAGGFLEWTEFLGHLYGTPLPEPVAGSDVVLEIEVDGAQQVKAQRPDAILIFVLPPTRIEQERRLRQRGDREDKVADRLRKAESEEPVGLELADHVLVNDNLDDTIDELLRIIDGARQPRPIDFPDR